MIKVSVMYPYSVGGRFDHDYYRDRHMPLAKARLGEALLSYGIDKGVSDGTPDGAPSFHAVGHLLFKSEEAFQAAFTPVSGEVLGDIPNYTDAAPVLLVSEIVIDHTA
ncbi:EthD family reductase [Aquisediminimonas sediminicola]|uniref:EthD family reductase n=1 Tax=Alteraquisediminimonas sediminicola TaxID=2676787 RepID=UPI001C8E9160|nr:EthD family reductase [Aquisediminimonas sediminicola]